MEALPRIEYVDPSNTEGARRLVAEKRYSVIPASNDGKTFDHVFCTEHLEGTDRTITELRPTSILDHIPDSTPLAEAFHLFEAREWFLTLRGNKVSGLVTYWAYNKREFRVQLYAGLSRVEELSRDVLAEDGCGVSSDSGLKLSEAVLEKIRERFDSVRKEMGGNRFVDELQFHHVHEALSKHQPWREFISRELARPISRQEYDRLYNFTDFRDAVMHGRTLFPTYADFRKRIGIVRLIGELIDHLDAYLTALR
jgi:hypothetical protein